MVEPVVLIIRDGWGLSTQSAGNAVMAADTPNTDRFKREYPWTILDASGVQVGLPEGYQGSSEVGHLNIGAGRIVTQELTRINDELCSGDVWKSSVWREIISRWQRNGSTLHLLGLLQDEGVHAHIDHLLKIISHSRSEYPDGRIVIHPFLDGRDTPPRSCSRYLDELTGAMTRAGRCSIGTIMGRYYGMDRSREWKLTDTALNCIVFGMGRHAATAQDAVRESYLNDLTPDGVEMFDEYIPPYCIGGFQGIEDGDVVLHTNYRQDRAIQLSRAFSNDDYPGEVHVTPNVYYAGMTRYYDGFRNFVIQPIDSDGSMSNILGEVISDAGLKQLRIAETQKFRHVTSFFNGKSTVPFPGEDQVMIPSLIEPSTYARYPEMEAFTVTDELLRRLEDNPYSFIVVNYANGDMVGHTGDFDAAKKAIETVDECLGILVERLLSINAKVLITSDHGNADQMLEESTGKPQTSHSLNPVEFIFIAENAGEYRLRPRGNLSDIAPTVLELLGLPVPPEMTALSLFENMRSHGNR